MSSKTLRERLQEAAADLVDTAQRVADAARAAPEAVIGAVQSGVRAVGDTVQSARTTTANAISSTGQFAGAATMVVGEVALFSAGVVPLLIFGGLPIAMGEEIAERIDRVAKFVRGEKVQFIGVNHVPDTALIGSNEDVLAIIYDPTLPFQDAGGYVQIGEEEIVRQLRLMSESRAAREAHYVTALVAVQECKKEHKLPLKTPDVRFIPAETLVQRVMTGPA